MLQKTTAINHTFHLLDPSRRFNRKHRYKLQQRPTRLTPRNDSLVIQSMRRLATQTLPLAHKIQMHRDSLEERESDRRRETSSKFDLQIDPPTFTTANQRSRHLGEDQFQ